MLEHVILVDPRNRAIGRAEKLAAHAQGLRHRAFSIFLVDPEGRLLLQQRHPEKYHSGGQWANSCCGHPRPGEATPAAARRRLQEELGATTPLWPRFVTHYHAELDRGMTENEVVTVFFGPAPASVTPNPEEVTAVHAMSLPDLQRDLKTQPGRYAVWLHHYIDHHRDALAAGIERVLTARLASAEKRS